MEVNSVAIVVIQKLTDMLNKEKSIIGQQAIVEQLQEIQTKLIKLRHFSIDDARAAKYLEILYNVEDAIETFALRISLQRNKFGFLVNHALFLKNFTAYKKLRRKIGKIKKELMGLVQDDRVRSTVHSREDASLCSTTPRSADTDQHNFIAQDASLISTTSGSAHIGQHSFIVQDASLISTTPRSADIDQHNFTVHDASLGSRTPRSADTDQHSFTVQDASLLFTTPGSADIDHHSFIVQDASLLSTTPRSTDFDQHNFTVQDASLGSTTQRSADTDQHSFTVQDASLLSTTPKSADIDQQSFTGDYNVSALVAEKVPNVHTDSPVTIGASIMKRNVTFQVPPPNPKKVNTLHEISSERKLSSRLNTSLSYKPQDLGIVGFDTHIKDLDDKLTQGDYHIIPLWGEKGSGKTTLARAFLAKESAKDYFHSSFAWVTINEESTAKEILLNLLKQVDGSKDQNSSETKDKLIDRVRERLKENKFLIVLDNLQITDTWGRMKDAFVDNENGTKIIITTRNKDVATSANQSYSLTLEKLTPNDAMLLFERKANSGCPKELKPKILEICDGLPLNVVLLGSLLSMKDQSTWQTEISSRDWQKSNVLALSYDVISDEEKLCLLYMTLFPQEYDIPVRRLLRLWLAEGFIKRPDTPTKDPEDVNRPDTPTEDPEDVTGPDTPTDDKIFPEDGADKCFKNLFQRSLILITNQRSDGGHRKCRLLGGMREHLFPMVDKIKLFYSHKKEHNGEDKKEDNKEDKKEDNKEDKKEDNKEDKKEECPLHASSLGARWFVEFVDTKNCSSSPPSKLIKYWRSYLSFNLQKKDTPAREVGVLLSKMLKSGFSLLRVLDLEGVYKPSLPDNLGNFFQLRYLGLRWTFLDHLPSSVGDLTYLEALDLKHTNVNSLPASIWKLSHLRHLNLNDILLDMPVTSNYPFPDLLTLCGLSIVDKECRVKNGLDRLRLLRELDLTFQLENCGDLLDWVSNLTSLEQLRLRSKDDIGGAATLRLKPLSKLTKLSHMNLLGKLGTLLAHSEFPQNLKVLTISVSELERDPMQTLSQLKHLTVLRLLAKSYVGTKISCPKDGFKELRVLKLWMLTNLEVWELEEPCMEELNELNIRKCPMLESVPEKLLKQKSFKELILNNMPKEFEETAEKNKGSHVSVIVKDYNFTPLPEKEDYGSTSAVTNSEETIHVNGC